MSIENAREVDDATAIELWGRVVRGFAATNRRLHAALAERFDLNEAEVDTLLTLHRRSDKQAKHTVLAKAAGFSTGGFTKIADKLTTRGLTERNACSTDRRVSYLQLTRAGSQLAAELAELVAELNREHIIDVLGLERAEQVSAAFGVLYQEHHRG